MQLPIITPAPLVKEHAAAFRDLFSNRRQFRQFENYLTGLTVLPNKSMANIARCIVDSADKSNLSRFFSEADWVDAQINARRVCYLLEQTKPLRQGAVEGRLILDDTLCEHVGDLFAYVDRHYNHAEHSYPPEFGVLKKEEDTNRLLVNCGYPVHKPTNERCLP